MRCIPLPTAQLGAESADMLSAARNPYEDRMTAEIVQIRDYQSKRAIERAHKELEKEAAKILNPFVETTGYTESGIDGLWRDTDPA